MSEEGEFPGSFDPGEESPERIRWDRISTLTEGARVFVGGLLVSLEDRWTFVSTRENPLLVIFYDCPDHALAVRAIRAGRHRNEYWNPVTPYGFILNTFSQITIAASFLSRQAFRLTVIAAVIALFSPLLPFLPPGVLLTVLYRRLWWRARIFRAYRDLARMPLKYFSPPGNPNGGGKTRQEALPPGGFKKGALPGGESYGMIRYETLPAGGKGIPPIIPEQRPRKDEGWYVLGAVTGEDPPRAFPIRPRDPFAAFGAIPGEPETLAKRYTLSAYILEITGGLLLLIGIALNILFITMIIYLLQ
jgi:hypothetical protein